MKKTTIYYNKKLKLNNPILVVGLPGIGNVGSLVGEHLKNELDAKKFATLYSPHFLHQAIMLSNGGLRLVSNRFYYYKNKGKRDVVILIGDTQAGSPEGQYEVNEKIVRFFKSIGGKEIYTIGGYNIGNQYIQSPRVFGVATDPETKEKLTKSGVIFGKASGMIWGSAGMIIAFSKRHKLKRACIMGETGLLEIDANSAKAVLEVLEKLLGITVDLNNLDKIKKATEKMLKSISESQGMQQEAMAPQPTKDNLSYMR